MYFNIYNQVHETVQVMTFIQVSYNLGISHYRKNI